MIYLDDHLPTHPKIMRAASIIGPPEGHARAFLMYVLGISYARQHLTNGFIPANFPAGIGIILDPQKVCEGLSNIRVGLWRKVRNGYEIHDYLDWNKKASDVKALRARDRMRKRAERGRK
jgi:hypothetical protein